MLAIFLFIGNIVPKGDGVPDFTRLVIPIALFLAVTSSALTVTAAPLASLRSKGTLRLLGTTPIGPVGGEPGAGKSSAAWLLVANDAATREDRPLGGPRSEGGRAVHRHV